MNPRLHGRLLATCCLALLAAACASNDRRADLACNELLYAGVPFTTKAPGDRALFVAPLADARTGQHLPVQERGFPITYGSDQVWERPVVEMVGEILQRELAESGLFAAVADRATPAGLVAMPSLVTFLTGAAESVAGARSFAEVGLRLQVFGPAEAAGKRALLLDQVYGHRQVSEVALNPVSPYRLVGVALQLSVGKALAGLDGSNVGRSHVPLPVALPAAEAAAPAR